ncbi:MAG: molybdopterin converting factor subunit 1 [Proteobacteria bacterium]|nr:molybdopterin converting factor subunit 1 [Pseudomonadota bacterium]MDA1058705.1 molybdopterin converting factor subunit 1 [Pseudomonadota bacterium]
MKVLYFAWLRQRVGVAEETVDLPDDVTTVGAMLAWLRERSDAHATALADLSVVRVAVNQDYARDGDPVANGDEVALFPPVTGG